jgi:hypothetical protein
LESKIPETACYRHIGTEALRLLLNDRRFWGIPMCLETPKGPDLKEDMENLALLRSLVGQESPAVSPPEQLSLEKS